MKLLASLLVGKPLTVLVVALVFLTGHLLLRFTTLGAGRHPRPLLVAAGGWALYAVWEWLVTTRTPEANMRVDLLLIWPALLVVSLVSVVRTIR